MFISGDIEFQKVFQALPYGYEHGVMGELYNAAGGDIGAWGSSLTEVPLWAFDGWGPEEQPHLFYAGMIRAWIFLFIQFDPFAPWFKAGFWTYYENMTAAQRYGLDHVIDRRFRPMYKYYIDNIAGPPEVDEKNSWGKTFLEYYKPCLTAYYIDQLLKENSDGTKTINDLMKLLFEKAEQGVAITREIFTEALNSLTNYDFTSVIENYLYGTGKLPLDGYLTDAPKVITGSATLVTSTSATLNGTVNPKGEAATYYFEYGTSTNYGFTTSSASAGSGSSVVSVNAAISGLISDTAYHYRLVATNTEGTSYGDDKTFSTTILYVESSALCGGSTPCYATIQAAIDAASSGATIKTAEETYDENLTLGSSKDLTLSGGWDSTFTTQSSTTNINSLTIADNSGTIEIENIVLQ